MHALKYDYGAGDDYGGGVDDDNNLFDFSDNNSDGQCTYPGE